MFTQVLSSVTDNWKPWHCEVRVKCDLLYIYIYISQQTYLRFHPLSAPLKDKLAIMTLKTAEPFTTLEELYTVPFNGIWNRVIWDLMLKCYLIYSGVSSSLMQTWSVDTLVLQNLTIGLWLSFNMPARKRSKVIFSMHMASKTENLKCSLKVTH